MGAGGVTPGPGGTGQMPLTQTTGAAVARVDADQCVACGQCVEACPRGAIQLAEVAVVNEDRCVGCSDCVEVCPVEAITLVKAPEGRGVNS